MQKKTGEQPSPVFSFIGHEEAVTGIKDNAVHLTLMPWYKTRGRHSGEGRNQGS
jgi:hypothetical protein